MDKIPHIIHYCWFGNGELPDIAKQCMNSWHKFMPDWTIMRWDESNFDIATAPLYVRQAYEARKFAFVSDYVRLWALEKFGGLYMDVDFMVYRPFDELMDKYAAFAGYEGSKRIPVMQGVIASEAHGAWVKDMISTYDTRPFVKADGTYDMLPNTSYFSDRLESQGFVADGVEKDVFVRSEIINELRNERVKENQMTNDKSQITNIEEPMFFLHVFPVHYFCPVLTTGEDVRTTETYCEHMGESSWNTNKGWKTKLMRMLSPKWKTRIIKLKRKILG